MLEGLVPRLLVGVLGGAFSGLGGVGGGAVYVPLMVGSLQMTQHGAHGTSLIVVAASAAAAAIAYGIGVPHNWASVAALGVPAFLMAPLGARATSMLPGVELRRVFAVLVLSNGVLMLISPALALPIGLASAFRFEVAVVVGAVVGFLSGLMGVGGGVLIVPAAVLLLGHSQLSAQGLALIVIIPTALSGAAVHQRMGNIDWHAASLIGLAGIPTAFGAAVAATFIPDRALRIVFGLLLLYIAWTALGVRLRRQRSRPNSRT